MTFNEKTNTFQCTINEIFDCVNNLYSAYEFCGGFVSCVYNRADEKEIAKTDGFLYDCVENVDYFRDYFDEYDILVLLGGKYDISPLVFALLQIQYNIDYQKYQLREKNRQLEKLSEEYNQLFEACKI